MQEFFYRESRHPIYEVELLPVLVAVTIWKEVLQSCQIVFYIDNEAAKAGLIRGAGATPLANAIIGDFCIAEAELQLKTWFNRVPTHSNLSDGPSRQNFELVNALGCARFEIPWPVVSGFMSSRRG